MNDLKKIIYEAVKDQSYIFGDDLFEKEIDIIPESFSLKMEKLETPDIKEDNFRVAEKSEDYMEVTLFQEDFKKAESLDELYEKIKDCKKCALGETRTKLVFGKGNPNADVLLIGEAPGAEEDKQGEPFVGRAGKLLTDILNAINFSREEVYIANILKSRPPSNRNPLPAEVEACKPYLLKQIELIKPKIILCLGRVAANNLLNNDLPLGSMRGQVYEFNNIKTMVTYHPAALLRNPNWKRGTWEDVQNFRKLYDELSKN